MRPRCPSVRHLLAPAVLGLSLLSPGCQLLPPPFSGTAAEDEEQRHTLHSLLEPHLALLGARNWIVIADPAYPILAGEGVDVVVADASLTDSLREVLALLAEDGSLTPRLWLCSELDAVPETRAPGVRRHRRELKHLIQRHLHYEVTDRIIALQLEQAAQTYRILYIKTNTPLPYSTVAIELDSGYWNSSAEAELRERLETLNTPAPPKPLPRIESSHYDSFTTHTS